MPSPCVMPVCIIFLLIYDALALLCYNGTLTYKSYGEDPLQRRTFVNRRDISRFRCSSTVFCRENAMCFVRSWSARAKHAWIVQRGCYRVGSEDPFPRSMDTPTRAMTCRLERLPDAEYKVCLCRADWCNKTPLLKDTFGRIAIVKNIFFMLNLWFLS